MGDSLGVSISQLKTDAEAVTNYYKAYKAALEDLTSKVGTISSKWSGTESGVVEQFNSMFDASKKVLDQAEQEMLQLSNDLTAKANEFEVAAAEAKAAFSAFQ